VSFSFAFIILTSFAFAAEPFSIPNAHTTREIEGWTVRVDDRLLKGESAALGERALKLLTARLVAIAIVVPEKALAKLRSATIQLGLDYADLRWMQYHPDAGWLKRHGYSETLAKCVHIPDAEEFLSPFENHRMPWVVLHELSHAYHDQVLGFDERAVNGRALASVLGPRQIFLHFPRFLRISIFDFRISARQNPPAGANA
jgi:hypothetical protein